MHELELELTVGDIVQIGDYVLTVVDIDGPEVSFRIDPLASEELAASGGGFQLRPGK